MAFKNVGSRLWSDEADFKEPTIFDIWNYRSTDKLMQEGRIKLSEVVKEDISFKTPMKW